MDINVGRPIARADIPALAFLGLRAVNVQSYLESNVKLGAQFEFSTFNAAVAGSAVSRLVLITGSKPLIIKDRQISCTGQGVTARVYKNPTYTGGTPIAIYNLRQDGTPPASTCSILSGATVTATGTEIAAPTYVVGATNGVMNSAGTFSNRGLERILAANSVYLLEITNRDNGSIQLGTYVTWYEGTTDLPTGE